MKLKLWFLTNTGRFRSRNEDALLIDEDVLAGTSMEKPQEKLLEKEPPLLFAVADGMGGLPCGNIASKLVLESLRESFRSGEIEPEILVRRAKEYLDSYTLRSGECRGMGTALAGIVLLEDRVESFNVGDCRVYLLRDKLYRLTRDHTEAFELYERGIIDEESIRNHPYRNFLTSALLGGERYPLHIFRKVTDLKEGDIFLVCSDGLWDELSSEEIGLCLKSKEPANCLFEGAYKGGKDNISFLVLKVL